MEHLLSAETCNTRGWGVEDLVDLLPLMWSLLGHSFLFSTADSAHLPVSSLHCSPDGVKVLCLGVWAHKLGVGVAELCIVPVLLCSLPVTDFLLYVKCVGICKQRNSGCHLTFFSFSV